MESLEKKLNEAIIDSNNQRHKFVLADAELKSIHKKIKKEITELESLKDNEAILCSIDINDMIDKLSELLRPTP